MAKIKPKKAYVKEISDGFSGIGKASANNIRTADIRNFRILPDGSLEKRCGWRTERTLPDTLRAYWSGTLNGISHSFAACGDKVFLLYEKGRFPVATISDTNETVQFFFHHGYLYLLDGEQIYVYNVEEELFEAANGYTPLYGYNWHPKELGEVNEPLNLLSNRIRVHYFNSTATTQFRLPFHVDMIETVRVDGEYVDDYYTLSDERTLYVASGATGSSIEVAFTILIESTIQEKLKQCTCAFRDCGQGNENLILYGSSDGNLLFCSTTVSDAMHNASKAEFYNSDPLYFSQDMILTAGGADNPIRSIYHNRGRLLAFHEKGCFSLSRSTDGSLMECYALKSEIGCTAPNTELYLEGDPIVINRDGIFRIETSATAPDDFIAVPLIEEIEALRAETFTQNAIVCEDVVHGELWFCDPNDEDGRVWIYQAALKQWVTFDNIAPRFFFRTSSGLGFARQRNLCVFEETLYTDDGAPFVATYQSGYVDFSSPEEQKRALRLTLCADSRGNATEITVQSEKNYRMKTVQGYRQSLPEFFDLRFALGRFRFLEVTLSDAGTARSRFYRLALFANL